MSISPIPGRTTAPIPAATMLGYQAEGARTNLCLQSQTLGTAPWIPASATIVVDQYIARDGTQTQDQLKASAGNTTHYVIQSLNVPAGVTTYSKVLRYTNNRWVNLNLYDGTGEGNACFDLLNGTVGAVSAGVTATIEATFDPAMWRCSLTRTSLAGAGYIATSLNATNTASVENWNAAGTETCGVGEVQLELGSSASSYIATTTTAATRNKDEESVSTSGNIAAAAGSIYLEYTPTHTPSGTIALWGTYVDASNYTAILHDATNLIFRKRIAGANYDATIANAFVSGTTYKACATWGTAGTSITLNGTEGTPHANTTAAQIAATMQWGADGNSAQQPGASLRNCRDWLRQLSASERAAITA